MTKKIELSKERVEDFVGTQTSIPTAEEIRKMEEVLGYALPNGANSIVGDDTVSFAARQILLHPALFRALASVEV